MSSLRWVGHLESSRSLLGQPRLSAHERSQRQRHLQRRVLGHVSIGLDRGTPYLVPGAGWRNGVPGTSNGVPRARFKVLSTTSPGVHGNSLRVCNAAIPDIKMGTAWVSDLPEAGTRE